MKRLDYQKLYTELGKKIAHHRTELGWTQDQLARAVRLGRTSIVNIEGGKQRPPLHLIWELADHLKVSIGDLLPDPSLVYSGLDTAALIQEAQKQASGSLDSIADFIKSID